jgi:hypothetical protein
MRRLRRVFFRGISYLFPISGLAFLIGLLWLCMFFAVRDLGTLWWQAAMLQLGMVLMAILVSFLRVESFVGACSRLAAFIRRRA